MQRFRSLETRIASFFLVLIIVVQVLGLALTNFGINRNAVQAISTDLANGEKVFRNLLDQNMQKRLDSVRVLAGDTAFRQTVANEESIDRDTIESLLVNHGSRAKAVLTMLISAERKVRVATGVMHSAALEKQVMSMLDKAEQQDRAAAIGVVDGKPYQLVVMPVKAPVTVAWVMMGFPIDTALANNMKEIDAVDVSLLMRDPHSGWSVVGSTLGPEALADVLTQLPPPNATPSDAFNLNLNGVQYRSRLAALGANEEQTAMVLLSRSVDAATAEYRKLEHLLWLLSGLGIVIAGLGSIWTAKRIAQPLVDLAGTAKRLEEGDYAGDIDVRRQDEVGALAKAFTSMRDGIAKREQEIRRLAYWDTLTDLPNRAQFTLQLNGALRDARSLGQEVWVIMMDLDRFKHVNDVMGHTFGDALLGQVAERLAQTVHGMHGAQVARLGGDEFAILVPGADLNAARDLANRIARALEEPLTIEDQTVDIGAGIGIAGYPQHADAVDTMLQMAEVAMYTAKLRNEGAVVYDASIDKSSEQSLSLLTELRHAVERNEFRLHVQPKVALGSGQVVGVEALVRWHHPERGNVFPDQFIPFAEQTGFIRVLTRWVLDQSAQLCRQMEARGIHLKFSVNLSTRDLLDQDLPNKFRDVLAQHQLSPSSFCLEITESAIMDDPVRAEQTLHRLHAMGVDLSIDDFGTGYSSLAYLKRLPVNELKIDKSFVLNMEKDAGDTKIVRSTIDLGHNMGLRVVAEGIETEAVWHLLAELGCDQGQGYFMSRPIPGEQLPEWVARWQAPQAIAAAK